MHINLTTTMLLRHVTYILPKPLLQSITSHRKLHINIIRTFYNDNKAIIHLTQNIRLNRKTVELKLQTDKFKEPRLPTLRTPLIFYKTDAPKRTDFKLLYLKDWWEHKKMLYRKYAEKRSYEMYQRHGPDIATAYLVLKYGGRIKLKNHENWIENPKKSKSTFIVPDYYDPDFILEGIDLNGYPINYDNLSCICDLYHLRWLILRGCNTVNDWVIDKLAFEYPMLEHLDVSECINVTERGLEAVYKMANLKTLTVTNYYRSVAMEFTCFLLEDINPYLKCTVLEPKQELLPEE
ncbi:distal membrane-arm assembly complex protein 2-like [Hylaeus anthracinus]|uniref:distal membrane-arm assembly complex protein 2-like n=1 Tax=Hylaeus anthracinus TaxID=313031 RepID=UPI0023B9DE64|nr:distal membrane-arm assembly complex protein 2-like [Hylaeus anthracinus]XP_054014812.1 distal membrane-arm assembly complex protein 2-like [Hylaeus anthracinus]XP_054014813.1 distal membrane-arm assembly complex protein 2-like [Hylaeus anthracinus]